MVHATNARRLLVACALLAGVSSGCAYVDVFARSFRSAVNSEIQTVYQAKDYRVLGPVRAQSRSLVIFGLYVEGSDGEALLWEEAFDKYGDAVTGLKDIARVSEYKAFLSPLHYEVITRYVGIAVSELDAGAAGAVAGSAAESPARGAASASAGHAEDGGEKLDPETVGAVVRATVDALEGSSLDPRVRRFLDGPDELAEPAPAPQP